MNKLNKSIITLLSFSFLYSCTFSSLRKVNIEYEFSNLYEDGNILISDIDINSININWISGNIYIYNNLNESNSIKIEENIKEGKDTTNKLVLRTYIENKKLNVQFGYPGDYTISTFKKDLHISLNSECNLDILKISTIQGNIYTTVSNINTTSIYSTSANFNSDNLNSNELTFNTVSGNLSLKGTINTLNMTSTSGDLEVTNDASESLLKQKTVSGDTTYIINDKNGYKAILKTVSGTFKSNVTYVKTQNEYTYKEGLHSVEVHSTSGNLEINTK